MNLFSLPRVLSLLVLFLAGLQVSALAGPAKKQGATKESPSVLGDTTQYRTASYRDWADAVDQKGKRKSVKCKPDKVDFKFFLASPDTASSLKLDFGMLTSGVIHADTSNATLFSWDSLKKITYTPGSTFDNGEAFVVEGRGFKGKALKVKFEWAVGKKKDKGKVADTAFAYNIPRLPMPDLHNVGEDIYGGVKQTDVSFTIGIETDPKGAHTVLLSKYKDALKTLVKEKKGGDLYHDGPPRCLDTFDKNGNPIDKRQKGLPPDKHNNSLLGAQVTLKLNIAASDSGLFPPGFGDLIYSNLLDPTPFDGLTIRSIATHVDSFMSCSFTPFGISDSTVYLRIVTNLDTSFAGPMDTVSWSCDKVLCTGVRPLNQVLYLHPNPNAAPVAVRSSGHTAWWQLPTEFGLSQNYPNPFNPTTLIEFQLGEDAVVTFKVYNVLGQEIATLLNHEAMDAGRQEVEFDARNLPSGIYFYRLTANGVGDAEEGIAGKTFVSVKKMMLVK
jgi:hypothetical protein